MNDSLQQFENFLSQISPNWKNDYPQLSTFFENILLDKDEVLSCLRGDIFFVAQGAIGKYLKKEPERYIIAGEFILLPLSHHQFVFKALESTSLIYLERSKLMTISTEYPSAIALYDLLLVRQQEASEFRQSILKLPKPKRLAFFQKRYQIILPLINRKELADFLQISTAYLRRFF